MTITEKDQPLLHAFVRKLADVVHAPRPSRIDIDCEVNASASFNTGLMGFLRQDLVLTVGLPLVSGLNARQFTAVLAHELGHFAQGGAMRLTYLIRRLNAWFARIVYERDAMDHALHNAMHEQSHWGVQLIAMMAIFFVWISRLILKLLMIIAHGVSSFMLRQMEFDADRCAARVAGSEGAIQTTSSLPMLQIASQAAYSDLSSAWRERRLADNLPLLIRAREKEMPSDLRLAITTSAQQGKTGWFDSHPSDKDRIASLKRENAPGLFTFDVPATEMFRNYEDLSRRATVAFYHAQLGGAVQPSNLVPTSSLVETQSKVREHHAALSRYFMDLVHPIRPVFPDGTPKPVKNPDLAAEKLFELRTQYLAAFEPAKAAAETFGQADERLIGLTRFRLLRNAGIKKLNLSEYKLARGDEQEIGAEIQAVQLQRGKAVEVLRNALSIGIQRLELALSLCAPAVQAHEQEIAPEDDYGEYELTDEPASGSSQGVFNALVAMRGIALDIDELRREYHLLDALLSECKSEKTLQQLTAVLLSTSRKVVDKLTSIHRGLHGFSYPYSQGKPLPLSEYLVSVISPKEQVVEVHKASKSVLNGFYSLYGRALSDLCSQAEQLEQSLGLAPLVTAASVSESTKNP